MRIAHGAQVDRATKHYGSLGVDEVDLAEEMLLIKVQAVDTAETLQVLVDDAALVNGQLLALSSMEIGKDRRNDVLMAKAL